MALPPSSPEPSRGRLPLAVEVREVGPRDGLQSEPPLEPSARAELADSLVAAGCRRIEAVSFVSERAVPAMAGADEVLRHMRRRSDCHLTALVPNVRGAERALAASVDEITVTIAASPAYNERNVRRTIAESLSEIEGVCRMAAVGGVPVDAVISCAFGSPYEGDVDPAQLSQLAEEVRAAGADAITLADTTGMATPRIIDETLSVLGSDVGLHLHDTRGTAMVNAYAALEAGVTRFDASIGGLGGSPFAPGAAGNLATEDFVALLDDLGIATGIDIERLLAASALAAHLLGRALPSRVAAAGPRSRRAEGA